jgi:PAS domain S-box-containing protein
MERPTGTPPAIGPRDGSARPTDLRIVLDTLEQARSAMWVWDPVSDRLEGFASVQALLGYPADDVRMASQATWDALVHPDDAAATDTAYRAHARGETDHYEHTYRARDAWGRWRWLIERGRIVERGDDGMPRRVVGTLTDVSDRQEVEQRADEERRRLTQIAGNLPGVLFQMLTRAERKRFTYVSDRCADVLGVPADRLLADVMAFEDLRVLDDDARASLARIDPTAGRGPWVTEYPCQRPDGSKCWLRITSTAEPQADGWIAWNGYMEDVTERRALDEERRRAAEAVAANAAKTRFLSRISHELRTPLNAVLGFTQLMAIDKEQPPTPRQAQRLALMREAGEHLLRMIGDLLDLTRIESDHLPLDLQPVDAFEAVQSSLALLGPQAAPRSITTVLAPVHGPHWVIADPMRLRQVLLNVLGNAIKFNRDGGRVEVSIDPDAADPHHRVAIRVADTGPGIAPTDLPRLFQPFERLAAARSGIEGTGIGLTVSQGLVQRMNGVITAAAGPAGGAVFTVVLPRAQTPHGPAGPAS